MFVYQQTNKQQNKTINQTTTVLLCQRRIQIFKIIIFHYFFCVGKSRLWFLFQKKTNKHWFSKNNNIVLNCALNYLKLILSSSITRGLFITL